MLTRQDRLTHFMLHKKLIPQQITKLHNWRTKGILFRTLMKDYGIAECSAFR